MTVAPGAARRASLPSAAGWFAGDDPYEAYIGPPLRLADDARRLDTSPAWFSYVGCLPALELLNEVGVEAIHEHNVGVANHFRAAPRPARRATPRSCRSRWPATSTRSARRASRRRMPGGRLRVGFHLYNDEEDADRAVDVLQGR